MSKIQRIEFRRIKKPLKVTFATASGEKNYMESLILKVVLKTKESGLGESPTSRAYPLESLEVMEDFLRKVIPDIMGKEIHEYPSLVQRIRREYPMYTITASGLDVALFRAYLSYCNLSEFSFWGGKSNVIETDITIPNIETEDGLAWVLNFVKKGFHFFKIKLKGEVEKDIHFVSAICEVLKASEKGDFRIRLDMNGSYTVKDFFILAKMLENMKIPIECIEQPLKRDDYEGLREIIKRTHCEIILDESIKNVEDLNRVGAMGFNGGVNIKIAKSGIGESKKIYEMAKKHGLKLMMGCMTETFVGISAGIFFAMGHGDFDYIDLDGIHFLKGRKGDFSIGVSGPYYVFPGY